LPHKGWAFLIVAVASLIVACRTADVPGVPLYPNGATTPLPRARIAQVAGPIATIDGKDVADQGGLFDLLPGCHVVVLDQRLAPDSYSLSSGSYWTGQAPRTTYALRMQAGARYIIRRDVQSEGQMGRLVLTAREELANGATTDLTPATSVEDLRSCKEWAATLGL
jgi:hypothetical protein